MGVDEALVNPDGCRWCGVDRYEHFQRWAPEVQWHVWTEPTSEQRKRRMFVRRTRRREQGEALLAG